MNLLIYLLIITILFILYSEITVSNIFLRIDSENKRSFNFSSLFHFLTHPFHNLFLWNQRLLDINYCFIISISIFFYFFAFYLFKNIYILQV